MSLISPSWRLVITAGFAMFSMFFGSGNLVYPLIAGSASPGNYFYTIIGFALTAVCVPFLGLLGMILCEGDRNLFFSRLGKTSSFLLAFLMLALMGPFAVIPRCITVAYGGITVMTDLIYAPLFSVLFCAITAALIWQRNCIIDIIALFLTPLKFGSIILLIVCGLWFSQDRVQSLPESNLEAFKLGLFEGYQTLDLMAAFFFACTIYEYLRLRLPTSQNEPTPEKSIRQLFRLSIFSSLLGGVLLTIVYIGFVVLGSKYSVLLQNIEPVSMLATIARHTLGQYGLPVVALTLVGSCLATATVLSTLFVDFLQFDICKNKLSRPQSILITMIIMFIVSLFGFQFIRVVLASILSWVYPFLIVYTVWRIMNKCFQKKSSYS